MSITVGHYMHPHATRTGLDGGYGGISTGGRTDEDVSNFVRNLERYGHAITEPVSIRPWHHNVAGCGVGHDDASFAETGRSMAAYYENGESLNGARWWETEGWNTEGVRHYGCKPRRAKLYARAHGFARHEYLSSIGADHTACPWCALMGAQS